MKKISLKSSIVAVSLSLALAPMSFAQSPAPIKTSTQATTNTQPLPGAKLAAGEVALAGTGLTAGMIVGTIIVVAGVAFAISESNKGNDFVFATPTTTSTATATR